MENRSSLSISIKSFTTAVSVIFALMVFTYILTFVVPGGEYARTVNESGNTIIDVSAGFKEVEGGIPFWKWLLSPVLVLGADGNSTLIAVLAFLFVIGGIFVCLEKCSFMTYMLDFMANKFAKVKYKFMAFSMLFFMMMGSFIGSFEEVVPMVPIVVAISKSLGWDALTGVSMSLLATGCGFAAGVCNPFSIGIAQKLAGLPMFSGIGMRLISFVLIYFLLLVFVRKHAKSVEKDNDQIIEKEFKDNPVMKKALKTFAAILGVGILTVISSGFIKVLQDYTMIIVAVMFLVAGIAACSCVKMGTKNFMKGFAQGCKAFLPSVLMILMAASIKYTLTEAHIQDTLLNLAILKAQNLSKVSLVLFLYAIVLVMNFFVGSASAKAFMMIPLLVPLANVFGVSSQLCIMAFAFGDGFSNVFYLTNAALLISLGLADVSYGEWVKYSWKFQFLNILLTSIILIFALAVGY